MLVRTEKNETDWRKRLTPLQYRITRLRETEPPYSGRYHDFNESGTYQCVCCGNLLFSSEAKFQGKAKWPTFWAPISNASVKTEREISHFVIRNEVACGFCNSHLGYVFEDGRPPTGVRYFINSAALKFTVQAMMRGVPVGAGR